MARQTGGGVLVVVGTPIGDVEDASPRLVRELATADVVAAEDTRRLLRLASSVGVTIKGRLVSYFAGNEAARTGDLVSALAQGARVVLVTDAGMPSVSDPGYLLVSSAVDAGVRVTSVPGPSAALTALVLSALPADRFCFEGFPPRRAGERTRWLSTLAAEQRTMVFFESRHRLATTLRSMAEIFGGDRRAAICRELTKTHEEVRRGELGELVAWVDAEQPLGEITVVVAGAPAEAGSASVEDAVALVAERVAAGMSRRDAIASAAHELGLAKRDVYSAVLAGPR